MHKFYPTWSFGLLVLLLVLNADPAPALGWRKKNKTRPLGCGSDEKCCFNFGEKSMGLFGV